MKYVDGYFRELTVRFMRTELYGVAIVVIATLALAGSAPGYGEEAFSNASVQEKANPWRLDTATNRLVHVPSTVVFPAEIGDLTRGKPTVFDESGRDVAIPYNREDPDGPVVVTVYVTLGVTGSAEAYFEESALAITVFNRDVKVENIADITMVAPSGLVIHGLRGVYRFTGKNGTPLQSELWVFKPSETAVKFRITYPAAIAGTVKEPVRALLGIVVDWQVAQ